MDNDFDTDGNYIPTPGELESDLKASSYVTELKGWVEKEGMDHKQTYDFWYSFFNYLGIEDNVDLLVYKVTGFLG